MKKILLTSLCIAGVTICGHAQFQEIQAGDKNIAISVNPVFDYLGDFFSDNSNGGLNLNGASIIYRAYQSQKKATRLGGSVDFFQNTRDYENPDVRSETILRYTISLYAGKEYHKNIDKWSLYWAWDLRAQVLDFLRENEYEQKALIPDRRIIKQTSGVQLGGGPALHAGAEYYFSDRLFAGIELSAVSYFGYQFSGGITREVTTTNTIGPPSTIIEKQDTGSGFTARINSSNIATLRMGLRF